MPAGSKTGSADALAATDLACSGLPAKYRGTEDLKLPTEGAAVVFSGRPESDPPQKPSQTCEAKAGSPPED